MFKILGCIYIAVAQQNTPWSCSLSISWRVAVTSYCQSKKKKPKHFSFSGFFPNLGVTSYKKSDKRPRALLTSPCSQAKTTKNLVSVTEFLFFLFLWITWREEKLVLWRQRDGCILSGPVFWAHLLISSTGWKYRKPQKKLEKDLWVGLFPSLAGKSAWQFMWTKPGIMFVHLFYSL